MYLLVHVFSWLISSSSPPKKKNATLREVAHIADTMSLQGLDNDQIQSLSLIHI